MEVNFYSADFPGAFYEYIDKQNSGIFLYANGPNANVGPVAGGFEFCQKMGKDLAVKTLAALESGKKSLDWKITNILRNIKYSSQKTKLRTSKIRA